MDLAGFIKISVDQINFWGGNHPSPNYRTKLFSLIFKPFPKFVVFGAGLLLFHLRLCSGRLFNLESERSKFKPT